MKTPDCNYQNFCCGKNKKATEKDQAMNSMEKCMDECMPRCMKSARWFLLIPGLAVISAFLFTLLVEPEIVRLLWLGITGILFTIGLGFYVTANLWIRKTLEK